MTSAEQAGPAAKADPSGNGLVTVAPPPSTQTAATSPASATTPARKATAGKPRSSDNVVRSVGVTLTLLAVAILGFVGYLYFLSGVQEARSQTTLYAELQYQLSQAIAPTGPTTPGKPVALLDIPAIGVSNMVVVEGTSPENLTVGPGHLRDTPLPGQGGISVVFGRRATFGAPFSRLPSLRKGDLITTITSQGMSRYQVITVSSSAKPVPFSQLPNQLLLVTADSQFAPAHYVEVEAKLATAVQPEPGNLPVVGSPEVALGRDFYALIPGMAWAIALAAAALLGSLAAARWARWPAWSATIPVILAIVWNLYQCLTALLPNLY
ncbi:MAG TPA: sortase [Streptosporangiaceae bacterium]|nr:sortase [Streptosporangiaceae bacterium]